jgi:hypothetical protein
MAASGFSKRPARALRTLRGSASERARFPCKSPRPSLRTLRGKARATGTVLDATLSKNAGVVVGSATEPLSELATRDLPRELCPLAAELLNPAIDGLDLGVEVVGRWRRDGRHRLQARLAHDYRTSEDSGCFHWRFDDATGLRKTRAIVRAERHSVGAIPSACRPAPGEESG